MAWRHQSSTALPGHSVNDLSGFTLIEFIVVIVLTGIVSVVAIARFLNVDTFNPAVFRDQVISIARTSQQSALGRASVALTVTPDAAGDEVTISSTFGSGPTSTIERVSLPLGGVTLSGDINTVASCESSPGANSITNSTPMTISFGELGDLTDSSGISGSTGAVNSALRICVNNSAVYSVCFSPSGFAYGGDCDT